MPPVQYNRMFSSFLSSSSDSTSRISSRKVPEAGQHRPFEVAHFALVVVAHIDNDGIRGVGQGIELSSGDVLAAIGDVEAIVVEAIRDDFVPHLDDELEETFVVSFNGDVEAHALQPVDVF